MKNRSCSPNMTNTPCAPAPSAWQAALRVAAAAVIGAAAAHGQPAAPALEVLTPDGARYLSGRERLAVRLTPAGASARVEFFVDGQRVCLRERLPFECDWDAGASGEARVVRILATLADGRRLVRRVHTPARAGFTFRSAVNVVLIPTIVTDRRGQYVTDLVENRFEIREDGVRQRLGYFSPPADGGLELVVALDISGSMRGAMPALKRGVSTLIGELDTNDMVTLIAFNNRVFELAARETDRARLLSLVAGLETSGYTSLYDAIGRSLAILGGEPQRKAVLVFTDGDDRSSFSSLQSVERRVEESDAPLYVVTLGRRSEVREVREIARRLAAVSGGQVFSVDRLDRLERGAGDLRRRPAQPVPARVYSVDCRPRWRRGVSTSGRRCPRRQLSGAGSRGLSAGPLTVASNARPAVAGGDALLQDTTVPGAWRRASTAGSRRFGGRPAGRVYTVARRRPGPASAVQISRQAVASLLRRAGSPGPSRRQRRRHLSAFPNLDGL